MDSLANTPIYYYDVFFRIHFGNAKQDAEIWEAFVNNIANDSVKKNNII